MNPKIEIKDKNRKLGDHPVPRFIQRAVIFGLSKLPDTREHTVILQTSPTYYGLWGYMSYYPRKTWVYTYGMSLIRFEATLFHEFGHFDHYLKYAESGAWEKSMREHYAEKFSRRLTEEWRSEARHHITKSEWREIQEFEQLAMLVARLEESKTIWD